MLFQQQFDGLESALGGLVTVGVKADGSVVWTSSWLTGDSAVGGRQAVTPAEAIGRP